MRQPLLIPILHEGRHLYQYVESYDVGGWGYTIPAGRVIDGASVPRLLWWFLPPDGLHRPAAAWHDELYGLGGKLGGLGTLTRRQCDGEFYRLMVEAGVSKFTASIAWLGVRLGGWYAWHFGSHELLLLPVRNASPTIRRRPRNWFSPRHIYATA